MTGGVYVYIVYSKSSDRYYTGMTVDIDRRVEEHNRHLSSVLYTKSPTDFILVFCSWFETREEARMVEKYLKGGSGREFRQNRLK